MVWTSVPLEMEAVLCLKGFFLRVHQNPFLQVCRGNTSLLTLTKPYRMCCNMFLIILIRHQLITKLINSVPFVIGLLYIKFCIQAFCFFQTKYQWMKANKRNIISR